MTRIGQMKFQTLQAQAYAEGQAAYSAAPGTMQEAAERNPYQNARLRGQWMNGFCVAKAKAECPAYTPYTGGAALACEQADWRELCREEL